MTMNSNKIWRGWATNFGNGDGMIPFFSHSPALPESYEIVLLPVADFDALCEENERLKSAMNKYSENETLHTIEALLADWKPITEMRRDDMETGMNFILWSPTTHGSPHEGRYWTQENEWQDLDGDRMEPTHFQLLPAPPPYEEPRQ